MSRPRPVLQRSPQQGLDQLAEPLGRDSARDLRDLRGLAGVRHLGLLPVRAAQRARPTAEPLECISARIWSVPSVTRPARQRRRALRNDRRGDERRTATSAGDLGPPGPSEHHVQAFADRARARSRPRRPRCAGSGARRRARAASRRARLAQMRRPPGWRGLTVPAASSATKSITASTVEPTTGSHCGGPTTQPIVVRRSPIRTMTGPATVPGHGPQGPLPLSRSARPRVLTKSCGSVSSGAPCRRWREQ